MQNLQYTIAEGQRARVYLSPNADHESAAKVEAPETPELEHSLPDNPRWFSPPDYGMPLYKDLFTARQLTALTTFSDLVSEARERALADARESSLPTDERPLADGGVGAVAYADAVTTYLAMSVDKATTRNCSLALWEAGMGRLAGAMGRQALPMQWSFAETNPLAGAGGDIYGTAVSACEVLDELVPSAFGSVSNIDAPKNHYPIRPAAIATDPPYYDNIGYADLSDFFYVWLRRSLKNIWPDLFRRVLTTKEQELVATLYRHGGTSAAEEFFMEGMSAALSAMHDAAGEKAPVTIFYAKAYPFDAGAAICCDST